VTRGWLPERAGSPGLNGGGTAAAVPPIVQGVPEKNCTKFKHHSLATMRHRVMPFSAKCSKRKCLHDKGHCLNTTIKYSLLFSWQVNYMKTKQSTW